MHSYVMQEHVQVEHISGLYYKYMTIINYASSGVNKLRASLNDDARVVVYDHRMFIVQATGVHKDRGVYLDIVASGSKGGSITVPLTSCLTGLESGA
jgi:hypothetical protein